MKTYLVQDSDWPWLCGDGHAKLVEAETPEAAALKACRIWDAEDQTDGACVQIAEVKSDFLVMLHKNENGEFNFDGETVITKIVDEEIRGIMRDHSGEFVDWCLAEEKSLAALRAHNNSYSGATDAMRLEDAAIVARMQAIKDCRREFVNKGRPDGEKE